MNSDSNPNADLDQRILKTVKERPTPPFFGELVCELSSAGAHRVTERIRDLRDQGRLARDHLCRLIA